jgi:D-alanine-D-alanine ligase
MNGFCKDGHGADEEQTMPVDRPNVLVLMGGPGSEREVSLDSGRAVATALRAAARFEVTEQVIDEPGPDELLEIVRASACDVIFPVLHGQWGEGGPLQAMLEEIDVAYVGSRPRPARLAMDKLATKTILADAGVRTPAAQRLDPTSVCRIPPPIVLKPIDDGSSVDLRICRDAGAIEAARRELHPRRGRLLAEAYIEGREVTAGIVGGEVLPLIEIVPAAEFYDYEAKYHRADTAYVLDPDLDPAAAADCRAWSILAYRRMGCRDLARVDFMVDERGPWFLEINTMPGFTDHSLVPMAARHRGAEMPALCEGLVLTAWEREQALRSARGPNRAGVP